MGYHKLEGDRIIGSITLPLVKWQRKYDKFEAFMQQKTFPFPLAKLLLAFATLILLHWLGVHEFHGAVESIAQIFHLSLESRTSILSFALAAVCSVFALAVAVWSTRLAVYLLLFYKGWLYEPVGKVSSPTKIWAAIIQTINRVGKPTFFDFQDVLPNLPLPSLDETVNKYLTSIRPLVDDEQYNKVSQYGQDFKQEAGKTLQNKLRLKWLISKNYISDWWKEFVYMRPRSSLLMSSVGGVELAFFVPTSIQAARASNVVLTRWLFDREVFQKKSMKPISLGGIPLCSQQYLDYYRTIRTPGIESDTMIRLEERARHIAVYCKGCWYKVAIYVNHRVIRAAELERTLQSIIDRTPDPASGEKYLSALTAGDRTHWANTRQKFFSAGVNQQSLKTIESAADIVFLDDEDRFYDESRPELFEREYHRVVHGDGYLGWWDKPVVITFSRNGRYTSIGEHSCADALIYGHMREHTKYHENITFGYTADGHCKGDVEHVPLAERLSWQLSDQCQQAIDTAYQLARGIAEDTQIASIMFKEFGKDLVKRLRVSPDAFVQMALQLAYYRDQGRFDLTYEATMTRLFVEGRTETVRSCTQQAAEFVKTMVDPNSTKEERAEKLRIACDNHQQLYRDAMSGRGIDRHLFGLYVVSKGLGVKHPFLDYVFSQNYILSTSQVPQHQQTELMKTLNKMPEMLFPAGIFPCPEGSKYGICYTLGHMGDLLSFVITSWKHLDCTDVGRMREHVVRALRELRELTEK